MKVKILSVFGKSAIIMVKDEDAVFQAYIIDSASIIGRVNDEVTIEDSVLSTATPYGIDWNMLYPEGICASPEYIQNAMYSRGIVSLEDLKRKPSIINSVLVEIVNGLAAEIYNKVKIMMEDYHE